MGVSIDAIKHFTKFKKSTNSLERIQNFNAFGSFFNRVNISPCQDFLIADDILEVATRGGIISAQGFTRFDLNTLDRIEGRSVGTRSLDFGGTANFYSYNYKNEVADEFSTLSVNFLENPVTNQNDSSKMEILFRDNAEVPSHTKVIPSIEFDRVIRTGDTTCLVLFKNDNGLFAFNPDCKIPASTANCQTLQFINGNNQITIEGLSANYAKVEIIGQNTDWQIIPICDGDCSPTLVIPNLESGEYAVKVNQSGADGSYCYREESIMVSEENTNTSADCDNLNFLAADGQITIEGLTASYDKVEIIGRNTDWQVIPICDGDCDDTQVISDLTAGEYSVKVNQGDAAPYGQVGSFCYWEEQVILENGGSSRNGVIDIAENLVLYPNPAKDRVNVRLPNLDFQNGAIHIYNVFGQQVSITSIDRLNQDVLTVDLNDFENGIYVMTIQLDGLAKFSQRFIIEHLK